MSDDFTFELKVRPGTSLIRMVGGLPGSGVDLKAVRLNGADVTDTGIEFRTNEDISGIEIELTTHPSEVSGLVTNARGEPVKEYSVVIFAQDQQRWGFQSRYLGMGRPDQDGRFKVRNLPAGAYYAVALEYVEPGESSDPEFLEKIRDRASRFSLNDGETKVLDLKLAGPQSEQLQIADAESISEKRATSISSRAAPATSRT